MDGAFFGTSYFHILLEKYPNIVPKEEPETYVPILYGFQLCSEHDIDILEEDMRDGSYDTSEKQEESS